MAKSEERLEKDRNRARRRRERKRQCIEVMTSNINDLISLNDNLRMRNKALIQELEKYGVIWGEGITPVITVSSSRALSNMRQEANMLHRNSTRLRVDTINNVYPQPLRNAEASHIGPISLHDGILSNDVPLRQAMISRMEQEQRHVQEEAATASMLLDLTYPSSTLIAQNFGQIPTQQIPTQQIPSLQTIRDTHIERDLESFIPNHMFQQLPQEPFSEQIVGAHQTIQTSTLPPLFPEGANILNVTNIPISSIGVKDPVRRSPFMRPRRKIGKGRN